MQKKRSVGMLVVLLLAFPLVCFAETIVLKSGQVVEGKVVERTDKYIKIDFQGVELTYFMDDIESINGAVPIITSSVHNASYGDVFNKKAEEIFKEYESSIVRVQYFGSSLEEPGGLGFIVREDGLIVTNFHTISGYNDFQVRFQDGQIYRVVSINGCDPARDICLIKIGSKNLKPIPLGSSIGLKKGDVLISITVTENNRPKFSVGEFLEEKKKYDEVLLRNTLPGGPGISGAPVFDIQGKVVGIYKGGYDNMKNWRFIIPVEVCKKFIEADNPIAPIEWYKKTGNTPRALFHIGEACSDTGMLDTAIEYLEQAIALKPDYAQAYSLLCFAYQRLKKSSDALAAAKKAAELNPDCVEVWSNLASAYLTNGMYSEALAAAKKAIAMEPDYSAAYETTGFILSDMGRIDEAKSAFKQAITIDNNRCFSNLFLAALYSKEGDHDSAREYYAKTVRDKCEVPPEIIQELREIGLQDIDMLR